MRKQVKYYSRGALFDEFAGAFDFRFFAGGFAYKFDNWTHFGITGEPYFRIYLPLRGGFSLLFPEKGYDIAPGGIYLVPSNIPFSFHSLEPCSHYWVHFYSDMLRTIASFQTPVELPANHADRQSFKQFFRLCRQPESLERAFLIRDWIQKTAFPFLEQLICTPPENSEKKDKMLEIVDLINRDYARKVRVEELCAMTDLPRMKFSATFRSRFGLPPKQYITACRVAHAKMMLQTTALPMKAIASACGFENEYFFYRLFRRYTGVTPLTFRKTGGI